eukprot:364806-Chlamydomonas_euryale.AAC.14
MAPSERPVYDLAVLVRGKATFPHQVLPSCCGERRRFPHQVLLSRCGERQRSGVNAAGQATAGKVMDGLSSTERLRYVHNGLRGRMFVILMQYRAVPPRPTMRATMPPQTELHTCVGRHVYAALGVSTHMCTHMAYS